MNFSKPVAIGIACPFLLSMTDGETSTFKRIGAVVLIRVDGGLR